MQICTFFFAPDSSKQTKGCIDTNFKFTLFPRGDHMFNTTVVEQTHCVPKADFIYFSNGETGVRGMIRE